jgi:hypothetical protein
MQMSRIIHLGVEIGVTEPATSFTYVIDEVVALSDVKGSSIDDQRAHADGGTKRRVNFIDIR